MGCMMSEFSVFGKIKDLQYLFHFNVGCCYFPFTACQESRRKYSMVPDKVLRHRYFLQNF
jgi:hypothetical protein